jgi:hypothetical protein
VEGILLDWIGGRLLDWLPRWIVRRFVKLEAIARQVKLGLLSTGAVTFGLTEAAPVVRVWFQVENHSGLDVVLDRIVLEVWAGQPIAYGVMARRTTIARHTTAREVGPFVAALTVPAIERVTQEQQQAGSSYNVNATAYFDTKLGAFTVQLGGREGTVPAQK